MGFLGALLGSVLIGGLTSVLGGAKSKQQTTTSSTTDPFYALMSPYAMGQIMQRLGALSGAGFPAGIMSNPLLSGMTGDIWSAVQKSWPDILKGLSVGKAAATPGTTSKTSLKQPKVGG